MPYFASPEEEQGPFTAQLGETSFADHLTQPIMHSAPMSSMGSGDSFTSGSYGPNTFGSMSEADASYTEQDSMDYSGHSGLASQPHFEALNHGYPQNPRMLHHPNPTAHGHFAGYHPSQLQPMFGNPAYAPTAYGYPQNAVAPPQQRHASDSMSYSQLPANYIPSYPRSVSAGYVPTLPTNMAMPGMLHAVERGGIYPSSQPSESSLPDMQSQTWDSSLFHGVSSRDINSVPGSLDHHPGAARSPDSPKKRQKYQQVGPNRLKPGPKPKPKTPKKGKQSSSPDIGPPVQGTLDPSVLLQPTKKAMVESEAEQCDDVSPPATTALDFGPDLVASIQQNGVSFPPLSQNVPQPNLTIQPPRLHVNGQVNGLPRDFLEKLYQSYHTIQGSTSGHPTKRFKCLIEGCERDFPRKSAIHSHIQTHLEDKPFVCQAKEW